MHNVSYKKALMYDNESLVNIEGLNHAYFVWKTENPRDDSDWPPIEALY